MKLRTIVGVRGTGKTAFCSNLSLDILGINSDRHQKAGVDLLLSPSSDLPTHLFLTGKKQVGKSTLLRKVREALACPEAGFETRPYEINGQKKGYCLHSLLPLKDISNDCPIVISVSPDRAIAVTETFETLGVEILKKARETKGIIILDELGKAERNAKDFCREVFRCLDGPLPVLGVLQADAGSFPEQVAAHPRVKVWEVTEENREELLAVLLTEWNFLSNK
ncbi:nucleoside-triphosphatase [Hominifimenecus sp. rT4P-3]|uniref:nucleoside-triphosphatase n=1 Tax=Hominifimenecus sp. rT4P-3 TaxID=3242979 RepID=UPI003DA2C874